MLADRQQVKAEHGISEVSKFAERLRNKIFDDSDEEDCGKMAEVKTHKKLSKYATKAKTDYIAADLSVKNIVRTMMGKEIEMVYIKTNISLKNKNLQMNLLKSQLSEACNNENTTKESLKRKDKEIKALHATLVQSEEFNDVNIKMEKEVTSLKRQLNVLEDKIQDEKTNNNNINKELVLKEQKLQEQINKTQDLESQTRKFVTTFLEKSNTVNSADIMKVAMKELQSDIFKDSCPGKSSSREASGSYTTDSSSFKMNPTVDVENIHFDEFSSTDLIHKFKKRLSEELQTISHKKTKLEFEEDDSIMKFEEDKSALNFKTGFTGNYSSKLLGNGGISILTASDAAQTNNLSFIKDDEPKLSFSLANGETKSLDELVGKDFRSIIKNDTYSNSKTLNNTDTFFNNPKLTIIRNNNSDLKYEGPIFEEDREVDYEDSNKMENIPSTLSIPNIDVNVYSEEEEEEEESEYEEVEDYQDDEIEYSQDEYSSQDNGHMEDNIEVDINAAEIDIEESELIIDYKQHNSETEIPLLSKENSHTSIVSSAEGKVQSEVICKNKDFSAGVTSKAEEPESSASSIPYSSKDYTSAASSEVDNKVKEDVSVDKEQGTYLENEHSFIITNDKEVISIKEREGNETPFVDEDLDLSKYDHLLSKIDNQLKNITEYKRKEQEDDEHLTLEEL